MLDWLVVRSIRKSGQLIVYLGNFSSVIKINNTPLIVQQQQYRTSNQFNYIEKIGTKWSTSLSHKLCIYIAMKSTL